MPLDIGVVISAFDTLIILALYSPSGKLRSIRLFEMFIAGLVLIVFTCLVVAVAQVHPPAGEVFRGFLPSRDIFVGQGLYQSCGTLGGMLMPHALYVGTAIARPRLLDHDAKYDRTTYKQGESPAEIYYRPSVSAIKSTLKWATWDLCFWMFCLGLFINSALEIVSGAAFGMDAEFTSLSSLYQLFVMGVNQVSATMFAVAMLFSGITASVLVTMAGQTVMEGAFDIQISPFFRRVVTRCIALVPALIISVSVGTGGISSVLTAVNYILAVGLIFVTLPIVWYVTHDKYMQVPH